MNSNSDRSAETASVASRAPSSWRKGYIYADAAVTALLLALAVERTVICEAGDLRRGEAEGEGELVHGACAASTITRAAPACRVRETERGATRHVFQRKLASSNWCEVSPLKACRRLDLKGYRRGWSPLRARIVLVVNLERCFLWAGKIVAKKTRVTRNLTYPSPQPRMPARASGPSSARLLPNDWTRRSRPRSAPRPRSRRRAPRRGRPPRGP